MSWKRQSLLHHGIQYTMDLMRSSFLDEKTGLVLPVIRCTFDIPSFTPYLYPPTHPPTQNSKSSMIWWLNSLIFRIIYEVYFKHHVLRNCSLHGILYYGKWKTTIGDIMLPCSASAIAKLLFLYSGSPLTLGIGHVQVGTVRRAVEKGKSNSATSKYQDTNRTNLYSAQDNDDFISSESDRQQLLMRWVCFVVFNVLCKYVGQNTLSIRCYD